MRPPERTEPSTGSQEDWDSGRQKGKQCQVRRREKVWRREHLRAPWAKLLEGAPGSRVCKDVGTVFCSQWVLELRDPTGGVQTHFVSVLCFTYI